MFGFSSVNIASVKEKSLQDVSLHQIRHLCEGEDEKQIEVTFFKVPLVAKEVISQLHHVQKSSTFQDIWTQYGKRAQSARKNDEAKKPYLSISEVVENIWEPAFHDWQRHAASAMGGTISLGIVDKLFGSYKNQKDDLERELLRMFQLIQAHPASRAKKLQTTTIERVTQIQRYQQLGQFASAADTIWEFKEAMGFTGDFKVIEDLRNQVSKFRFSTIWTLQLIFYPWIRKRISLSGVITLYFECVSGYLMSFLYEVILFASLILCVSVQIFSCQSFDKTLFF